MPFDAPVTVLVTGCTVLVLLCFTLFVTITPLWWWRACDRHSDGDEHGGQPPPRAPPAVVHVALARRMLARPQPTEQPLQALMLARRPLVPRDSARHRWMQLAARRRPPRSLPSRPSSICVSVPSYRDPEAPHTILSALSRAAEPQRVVVAVCDQRDPRVDTDIRVALQAAAAGDPRLQALARSNVRVITMDASAARGPIWARHRIETELFHGEDFLFMVDSHTQFAPRWDEVLMADYDAAPCHPAVLTTYAREYRRQDRQRLDVFDAAPYHLCLRGFERGSNFPLWNTVDVDAMRERLGLPLGALVPTFGWSANYALLPREAVRRVPFHDRHEFPFLFFGEEVGMAVRLFTAGIPMFTPRRQAVVTLYDRAYRPLFWDEVPDDRGAQEAASRKRMQLVLGMLPGTEPRGVVGHGHLGDRFTVAQYEAFSGIALAQHTGTVAAFAGEPQGSLVHGTRQQWRLPDGALMW